MLSPDTWQVRDACCHHLMDRLRRASTIEAAGIAGQLGATLLDRRRERHWTLRRLADESGVSVSHLQRMESGHPASLEAYVAVSRALGLRPAFDLVDPRRRSALARAQDPVHAAMGEAETVRLRRPERALSLDEPYQHFQFAGRADLVAWTLEPPVLLHIENRTRFPNVGEAFGAFNAKRRWLAPALADRLGIRRGFQSVTHVLAGLWSSEVIHTLRMHPSSFRSVCPDGPSAFDAWIAGAPIPPGETTIFLLFDPVPGTRNDRRWWVDLEGALRVRPRYAGYAAALAALQAHGLA